MRAAIYDPYLDTLGGGERYVLTVALALKRRGWDVDVCWGNSKILGLAHQRLGLDLSGVNVVGDINRGRGYDFVFWLSDGSVPFLLGRKNVIHFQTPFRGVGGKSILNKLKFLKVMSVVCNSRFTKKVIDKEFGIETRVVYPPVAVDEFKSKVKENLIISVGRFSQLQQSKRQDILVEAFRGMYDKGLRGWRFVLVGSSDVGRTGFVERLKKAAKGYPVDVLENLPFSKVKELYSRAKIFWSASGYGVDEHGEPQKVEHFGITVVEAMAAGCLPVVVDKGGHREIVVDGYNGYTWSFVGALQKVTLDITRHEGRRSELAKQAKEDSKKFSQERFETEIFQLAG